MQSVNTLPPSAKRRHSEDNVTTVLPPVKKLKKKNNVAHPNMKANLHYDKDMSDEDMSNEESTSNEENTSDAENMNDEENMSDFDYENVSYCDSSSNETCNGSEGVSDSEMSFILDEVESRELTIAQGAMSILPCDPAYIWPDEYILFPGAIWDPHEDVIQCQEEIEQELDDEDIDDLIERESCVREERRKLLDKLHATASVRGLEKMMSLSLTEADRQKTRKGGVADSDSDSDSDNDPEDWSKPDAVGWESAADGSRLRPKAIELMLQFFKDRQHLSRAECEEYCLKSYVKENVGAHKAREQPLNIHAYPSESQYPDSYMVEIIDTAITNPVLMTQFFITHERLDHYHIARAKQEYGNFVPEYTYVGHMGLAPKHRELFVWRIVSPAGRPFAADADRLGLRVNQDKYVSILKNFVDFVCEPLRLARGGDRLGTVKDWPLVLHNPILDASNIIVRTDWSGIACVLLWGAPAVMTLPFGASLSGLLCLEGTPEGGADMQENPHRDGPFISSKGYSREARELQRLWMYYLREKYLALAHDPQPWHRLFEGMALGMATTNDTTVLDMKRYATEVDQLKWDWFHFEMGPIVPRESTVACLEIRLKEEDNSVDMSMDID
ncbi:hypothetical protein F5Y14DRAFT_461187 [Nemania sp. NC0429]|nr:hypothetical protein F5Y14DRAFT_461187 [Nemania sp. NC0429]